MKSHLLLAAFLCLLLDSNVLAQTPKESYGRLPLSFEANQGQTDPKVKFLSRGSGYTLFLAPNEAVFSLIKPQKRSPAVGHRLPEKPEDIEKSSSTVLRMQLLGANPAPEVIGVNELTGKSNYFLGNDPATWHANVPNFARVKYQSIYPGIDLVFYGRGTELENDFIVAPRADLSAVSFHISGAKKIAVHKSGDLYVHLASGKVLLKKPVAYQIVQDRKIFLECRYVLLPKHEVRFEVPKYDRARTLIIDPVLSYSTYLSGTSGGSVATGIAVDVAGNAYVTGTITSVDFPTTAGSFQSTAPSAAVNAFISKISQDGKALIYSTYLGGSLSNQGSGSNATGTSAISVDTAGNVYVVGSTIATDFPAINAFQASCNQCFSTSATYDVFITKLNPTGSTLLYSSYLGGSSRDFANGLAVDNLGGAYVTGDTVSTDFPTTPGAIDTSCGTDGMCNNTGNVNGALSDAFVAKFDTTRSGSASLVYSTYLGGSAGDAALGIAVDPAGNAYIAGITTSSDFPITAGAFQRQCGSPQGGCFLSDAFVAKINSSGTALVYSTYLGGSSSEWGYAIAVDSAGNAYVTGATTSSDFPVTPGAFQTTSAGGTFAFVTKLNSTGSALVYSSYLGAGNNGFAEGDGIAVDGAGNAYVVGRTGAINFPTVNATQPNFGGGFSDIFVSKLNPSGSQLLFSSYLGGSDNDGSVGGWFEKVGLGIAVSSTGDAYVAGATQSTDYPTTPGAFQTSLAGTYDAVVTRISGLPGGSGPTTRTLIVASTNPGSGVAITVSPSDNNSLSNGITSFALTYNDGAAVMVSAPPLAAGNNFSSWTGCDSTSGVTCTVTMSTDRTVIANYVTPPPPIVPPTPVGVPGTNNPVLTASEPISTANGNYYYQHADFAIPGRGLPLVFQRSYNSLDNYSGPLGSGWTQSYNIVLVENTQGLVFIKWGDGHAETFTPNGVGYANQPGVFNTLAKNADGTFVLTRKDQTQFAFSTGGALTSIRDKNANVVSLTYNGAGNLVRVANTVGRNLNFSYDPSNRITQIIDPLARMVTFQYDGNNNLAQATDAAGGITTFAYDASHRVTSITQPNGQILLQNTYDSSGRVTSQTGGRGFSTALAYGTPNPTDTTITDARGSKTIHTYDSLPRIVKITDATGGMTSFTYDVNNDRTSVTNQNGKTTNFSYDSTGNVSGITDPLGNAVTFTYDTKNDLLAATNAKGKTTTFAYDVTGNLTAIKDAMTNTTAFGYDGFGELVSKTDARGNSTAYLYDSLGNLTRIADALSHSTVLNYDGIGRLTSITDPNGHTAMATYDALSRLVKITDPLSNQTQFAYDSVGNLLKITDAKGNATNYAYDATNNLVSVTDALGHITRYAYDANNNRITFTNAKGNATVYVYDVLNRLSRITDPLSFANSYSYDPIGNVLAVTDAKGQTNQFTYDALKRLLGISYADGKNVAYSYDANGNRMSMADSHGTTGYSYDDLDRLSSVANPNGKVVTYAYDAVGNRKSLIYPDGKVVSYSFDPANRLSAATDWLGRNTAYSYDAAGNLIRTSYPNSTSIAFGYDAANRLANVVNALKGLPALSLAYTLDAIGNRVALSVDGVRTNFSYDALNELLSAQLGPLKSTWTYDAVGNRSKQTSPLGTITYTYDAGDRLLAAGTATFAYDANGNQTSVAKTFSSQPLIYQYDAANRLVAVTGGRPTSSFAYDGDGNRISQSVSTGIYNYLNDVATALPVVLQESGRDGNISYAYGLGLISESSPTFDYFYHYDGLGSVIALSNVSGKPSAAYVYDPWGNSLINVPDSVGTKNKFRFTGEALDPGTQLYYLRARYYDASTGRFVSRDKFPGFSAFPQTSNPYSYANRNPVNLVDPSGLLTYGFGISASGFLGVGGTASAMLVYDDQGHRGVALTAGGGFGFSASFKGTVVITNKDTISDLIGQGYSAGVGFSLGPVAADARVLLSQVSNDVQFAGIAIGAGIGVSALPISFTVNVTGVYLINSWLVPSFSVDWSWVSQQLAKAGSVYAQTSSGKRNPIQ